MTGIHSWLVFVSLMVVFSFNLYWVYGAFLCGVKIRMGVAIPRLFGLAACVGTDGNRQNMAVKESSVLVGDYSGAARIAVRIAAWRAVSEMLHYEHFH